MIDAPPGCRLCGAPDIKDFGAIPNGDYFAGRVLDKTIFGGRLYQCRSCLSMFKHPILTPSHYIKLYESGVSTQWSGDARRLDLQIIRSLLDKGAASLTVLDVGCSTGDFLKSLPAGYLRFGVEPSPAVAAAKHAGIKILAAEIDKVPVEMQFDVITIIDVIEHVADPGSLLTQAYRRTAPGGRVIVSTGDPELPLWRRLFKARFWYTSFPEHISFPSNGFCQIWCKQAGATVSKVATHYESLSRGRQALNALMQTAFYISPSAFSWVGRAIDSMRKARPPRRQCFSPGIPGLFADHQILIIHKPAA